MDPFSNMFFFQTPQFYQPKTDDPAQFPRSEEIKDEDCLMHLTATERLMEKLQELQHEQRRIQDQIDIVAVDLQSHKVRLFQRLRDLYSVITGGYGYGWRKHQGAYFVVGWDEQKPQNLHDAE